MSMANSGISQHYEEFYRKHQGSRVYPTEFVVRTFLASYPHLNFPGLPQGASVLDVGFGDGRNTAFLCEQGFAVSGTEISSEIVHMATERMNNLGFAPDLQVGRNSSIPFADSSFDCILACHSCYYCDEGETLHDNMREYQRVLRPDGFLIASVADRESYIFNGASELADGTLRIANDPYGNRNGYRLQAFSTRESLWDVFSSYFHDPSFGHASNDYYGVDERVHWIVCRRK